MVSKTVAILQRATTLVARCKNGTQTVHVEISTTAACYVHQISSEIAMAAAFVPDSYHTIYRCPIGSEFVPYNFPYASGNCNNVS